MDAHRELERDLAAFATLLSEEYGLPLSHWIEKPSWDETDAAQIARALEILIILPFAEPRPLQALDELGSRKDWQISDSMIAASDWQTAWQYGLLADMDNASKAAGGGMMTPSDPRQYLLRIRYERGVFGAFAAHMAEFFCGRGPPPSLEELQRRLPKVPGLANCGGSFLAGLTLMIEKLGFKAFCAYCEDRS